jgi:hypothetical protein
MPQRARSPDRARCMDSLVYRDRSLYRFLSCSVYDDERIGMEAASERVRCAP